MKNLFKFLTFSMLACTAVLFTSCEDEPGGGTDLDAPTVSITSSTDITVDAGDTFTVSLSATEGADPLQAVTVLLNNVQISTDKLVVNGTGASSAAILITDAMEKISLDWEFTITAEDAAGTNTYTFEVRDEGGRTSSATATVTTVDVMTPPILSSSFNSPAEVDGDVNLLIDLLATNGSTLINSIEVTENGEFVDVSRLQIFSQAFGSNPQPLTVDPSGFSGDLTLRTPDMSGTYDYVVTVRDENDLSSSFPFTLIVTAGTPLDTVFMGVLFNQGGDVGFGGLDLDDGFGTGSASSLAEIKDDGIDTDLPAASNWKQTISPVNGSIIKYLVPGQNGLLETFTFGAVDTKETIQELFQNNGIDFTGTSSNVVQAGDMFVVENSGKYYLINVANVNVTADDNLDSYTMDIKR